MVVRYLRLLKQRISACEATGGDVETVVDHRVLGLLPPPLTLLQETPRRGTRRLGAADLEPYFFAESLAQERDRLLSDLIAQPRWVHDRRREARAFEIDTARPLDEPEVHTHTVAAHGFDAPCTTVPTSSAFATLSGAASRRVRTPLAEMTSSP
jgi:hypothetical protein